MFSFGYAIVSFVIYIVCNELLNSSGTCAIRRCVFFQIKKVSGGGETTTVKPTTPKPDDDCKDLDKYAKYCPSWAKKYCTGKYEAFMTKYCKKSCGHCTKACNMVKVFGKLNGDHTLKLTSNGE